MKAVEMKVWYGKNQRFVASHWVMENAIEEYKKTQEEMIRRWGWKKEITFKIYNNTCEVAEENDKPMGHIFGYTKNGFETIKTK